MSQKSITPADFVCECLDFAPDAQAVAFDLPNALAGWRLHHGERAQPMPWRALRRYIEEARGCVLYEPDIGEAQYRGVRLTKMGLAMRALWEADREPSLACGCCGQIRLVVDEWVNCLYCELATAASETYTDVPEGADPVELFLQAELERALEGDDHDAGVKIK